MPPASLLPAEPTALSHDELSDLIVAVRDQVERRHVSDLFLASLSTRRLDWRSVLGSYAVFLHYARHPYDPGQRVDCVVCGYDPQHPTKVVADSHATLRLKGGGIMHEYAEYAVSDLDAGRRYPPVAPTEADLAAMRRVLDSLRALPPNAGLGAARDALSGAFKSNQGERQSVLEILGYCGILRSAQAPSYFDGFVRYVDRRLPPGGRAEWRFPMGWWTGADGVNDEALRFWFPSLV